MEHEKVPFPANKALKTWNLYTMNKKTGKPGEEMFYAAFQKLVSATPLLLLPLTRLQEKVSHHHPPPTVFRHTTQSKTKLPG